MKTKHKTNEECSNHRVGGLIPDAASGVPALMSSCHPARSSLPSTHESVRECGLGTSLSGQNDLKVLRKHSLCASTMEAVDSG